VKALGEIDEFSSLFKLKGLGSVKVTKFHHAWTRGGLTIKLVRIKVFCQPYVEEMARKVVPSYQDLKNERSH